MKPALLALAACGGLLVTAGRSPAGVIYSTVDTWLALPPDISDLGESYAFPFSPAGSTTFGHTFSAPVSDNVLLGFTFYIFLDRGDDYPATVNTFSLRAYVFEWSDLPTVVAGNAVGSPLFVSPSSILLVGNDDFQAVTVTTGGTVLVPGGSYVMLLTLSDPDDYDASSNSIGSWGALPPFSFPAGDFGGGRFVFINSGQATDSAAVITALTSGPWSTISDGSGNTSTPDPRVLAFRAEFGPAPPGGNVIPEPATVAVFGLMAVGGFAARRRRRVA